MNTIPFEKDSLRRTIDAYRDAMDEVEDLSSAIDDFKLDTESTLEEFIDSLDDITKRLKSYSREILRHCYGAQDRRSSRLIGA